MSRLLNRKWPVLLGVMLLAVSSCSDDEPARLTEPVVGGDLELVMHPGEGTETNTGRYFVELLDWDGNFGLREGTANHVGWIDSEYGPRHVVTFTAGRDNPRGGEPEFCVVFFPGGIGCGLDADEPTILGGSLGGGGRELAEVFGGPNAVEVVLTTESGMTVSVLTAEGYAYAEWPEAWGLLELVDAYDIGGDLVATLDFQAESGG